MKDTDIALKKIAKGTLIVLVGLVVSKILAYAYRFVIARIGVEQYGLLSIGFAIFNIITIVSLLGTGEGVIRFVSFYKGKLDQSRIKGVITSTLKITLFLSLACSTALFFASDWVAITFFHNSELSILFKVLAFGIPLDVLRSIFFSSIKGFQKVEYETYGKSLGENIAKVVLTLVAVYLGFGVVGAAVAYVASVFISFVLSFYFLEKKVFPIIATEVVSKRSDKDLLFYSLPLLFTGFVFFIIQWTDTLMLGSLRTVSEVGVYNIALPIASLLYFFPAAIRTLFFPILSELYAQNKKDAFKSVYRTVTKWILVVNAIVFIFLIVFSKQIVHILFGNTYLQDKVIFFGNAVSLSVSAIVILSFGMILGELLVPSKDVLMVLNRTKFIFVNTLIGACLNIILNYLLIPPYGIIGAAIATGISYFMIALVVGIKVYSVTSINPFKPSCTKIVISALFILLIMTLLKVYLISNVFYLVLAGVVLLIAYFALLVMIKSFDKEDVMIIEVLFRKLNISLDLNRRFKKFV